MPTSMPQRPKIGTGDLSLHVDRLLDERHTPKILEPEITPMPADPLERIKALIKKPKP